MPAERVWARRRTREPRPGAKSRSDGGRIERWRSRILTTALASVLLGLGGYTLHGNLENSRAAHAHRGSLALDALFAEARNAIALEEVHVRNFQVDPTVPVRLRYVAAAGDVTKAMDAAARSGGRTNAERIQAEHNAYRQKADRLVAMIANNDPGATPYDRAEVAPAYVALQHDIDAVSRAHHATADREAEELRRQQSSLLAGTTGGYALGLALVAMIWRLVLGYQRRLLAHVAESRRMALHDSLTGLPNRAHFNQRLLEAVADIRRDPRRRLGLMILDLNGFKAVNDTLGHHAGDQLLTAAGQRLREAVREEDMVARLGGDEFAVLLPDVEEVGEVRAVADRINHVLRSDFSLAAGPAAVSGSIGVVVGPSMGDPEELVRHADTAMYRAKQGGGGVAWYDPRTDFLAPEKMGVYGELRALLDNADPWGQLALYYQPQVRLTDGAVSAVEALVRWQHPVRGLLLPEDFLPLAESRGLEIQLTYHLLAVAVEQATQWYRSGNPMVVSVNVSPRCLVDGEFVERVMGAVHRHGLPPHLLRLEITENSVMSDPDRAVAALRQVHAHGVHISVDDYGTGFSSMAQLKRLPADELKIDRAFVRDLTSDTGDEVLVRSTVALAHDLGMSTVAEGVEDLAALLLLGELGCDYAQGFALSHAVPAVDLPAACRRAERRASEALLRLPVAWP